jgi:hypothetical protein
MTTNMRMAKFTQLMERFWGRLRMYEPEEGYSHDPYEAEAQVRHAFKQMALDAGDRRINNLINGDISQRLVDEAVEDEINGRLVRIRTERTRVKVVKNYFASMLGWRNRIVKTHDVGRKFKHEHRR